MDNFKKKLGRNSKEPIGGESSIREQLRQYVLSVEPLIQFSGSHLAALAITLLLAIAIPWQARSLAAKTRGRIALTLAWITALGFWLWCAMHLAAGTFEFKKHLPGHLCFFNAVIMPWVIASRNKTGLEIAYYWTFSGILQAALTPAEVAQPMHLSLIHI